MVNANWSRCQSAGSSMRPLAAGKPGLGHRGVAGREEPDRGFAEARAGEHHALVAPAFVADDADALDALAVREVERQVVPALGLVPPGELVEHEEHLDRSDALDVSFQLLRAPIEVRLLQRAADLDPEQVA